MLSTSPRSQVKLNEGASLIRLIKVTSSVTERYLAVGWATHSAERYRSVPMQEWEGTADTNETKYTLPKLRHRIFVLTAV